MSKLDSIDLMKLWSLGSNNGWNDFLTECDRTDSISRLQDCRRRIQVGMKDLAKKKLNTDEIDVWFARLIKSLDKTMTKIDKRLNPMQNDNPLNTTKDPRQIAAKKERDLRREKFTIKGSY